MSANGINSFRASFLVQIFWLDLPHPSQLPTILLFCRITRRIKMFATSEVSLPTPSILPPTRASAREVGPTEASVAPTRGTTRGFVPGVDAEDSTDGVTVPVPAAEYLVELSGVSGTPKVSMFEARKHLTREPSERIGELSGVVSVREGVL